MPDNVSNGRPAGHPTQMRLVPMLPEPVPPASQALEIPWSVVAQLRLEVSNRVADWTKAANDRGEGSPGDERRRVFGWQVVQDVVKTWVDEEMHAGRAAPSQGGEAALCKAVFAEVFELGRLQPLVDDPDIENIEVNGFDNVWLSYSDGRVVPGPPVASSDAELVQSLQMWAARAGRTLSPSKPSLHLDLADGMSRLAAMIETSPRPQMVIRKHRMVTVTLKDLVDRGMISQAMAAFLVAAVRSNANIVVTGAPNAGKTTLLRALASAIPPMERYATLETEFELHLDKTGWHPRMVPFQAKEGSTEHGPDGRPAGQVTLQKLVEDSLRMNFSRLIVGEVRGEEVLPMLEAVSTGGKGSICTIHANGARHAFERIVSLCLSRAGMNEVFAYRLAAGAISYVVNVAMIDYSIGNQDGARHRFVDQIVEVSGIGEMGRPNYTDIFAPGPDLRGTPAHPPTSARLPVLERAGFDRGWINSGDGMWSKPAPALPSVHGSRA